MKHLSASLAALVLVVACGEAPAAETVAVAPAADPAGNQADDRADDRAGGQVVDQDGVAVRIVRNGHGRAVEPGDELTVHTTGWLYDENAADNRGEKFWSSLDTGERLTFTLGAGQMIQGWDRGLPGMLIGEIRELTIPPGLAYGESGRGPIPPAATLVFEVELFSARTPEEVAGS
ncbi:MAG TPA: FKBP-type peptidyl-prolyl cis-trans isomerase [Woeseiaceae bacterium]|nr:FKBP-type peptidyl-prolyl cis-trans isomerase [Woeseiaceae bacterium]